MLLEDLHESLRRLESLLTDVLSLDDDTPTRKLSYKLTVGKLKLV